MSSAKKIYVYGSCVSRDTLEFMDSAEFELLGYLARHSLLSHGTDASYKLPGDLEVPSNFQERMIRTDWEGNKLTELKQLAPQIDVLLWDLIDERHGVHWFPTGEIVTRSIDLLGSEPATSLLMPDTRISFGSDTHFEGWCAKAEEFVEFLKAADLLTKTRLIRVDWAEESVDGTEVPWSMGVSAAEANTLFERYYDFAESLGVATIKVPSSVTLADPNHKWGLAPFHYVPGVYEYIRGEVLGAG